MKRVRTKMSAAHHQNPPHSSAKRAKITKKIQHPPTLYIVDKRLQQQESINATNRYSQKAIKLTLYPSLALFCLNFAKYQNDINQDLDPNFKRDTNYLIDDNNRVTYLFRYIINAKGELRIGPEGAGLSTGCKNIAEHHHMSTPFCSPVLAAGQLGFTPQGRLCLINNGSGHYKPAPQCINLVLDYLARHPNELAHVEDSLLIEHITASNPTPTPAGRIARPSSRATNLYSKPQQALIITWNQTVPREETQSAYERRQRLAKRNSIKARIKARQNRQTNRRSSARSLRIFADPAQQSSNPAVHFTAALSL